jgi:hypothetical protein
MTVRKVPGSKLANDATGEIIYTAPEQKLIGLNKLFLNSRFLKLLKQDSNDYKRFVTK